MRVFVAGGTGAVGQALVPALITAGHQVTASTRSQGKAARLRALGAEPVVVDGLDRGAVVAAVKAAAPDVIVHQMTSLQAMRGFRGFDKTFAVTNELRTKGTDYLLEAASVGGVRRVVVQGYTGWPNERSGGPVKTENDPLGPPPARGTEQSLAAIRHVEQVVPTAVPEGLVLRYGNFYGPGASQTLLDQVRKRQVPVIAGGAGIWSWIETTDAAAATVAAVERGAPGVYNVVDDEPAPVAEWLPYLAKVLDARAPLRVPAWLGRLAAGDFTVVMMTTVRGSSNAKAKRDLLWTPRYASWREGFRAWVRA
jgi:nucleoside-diphosphate-sugar epimerase